MGHVRIGQRRDDWTTKLICFSCNEVIRIVFTEEFCEERQNAVIQKRQL